jgi:hypothetical protein
MTMPRSIEVAVRLIWGMIALGAINAVGVMLQLTQNRSDALPLAATLVAVLCAMSGLMVWLSLKIRAGRNWARTVYIAIAAVSLLNVLQDVSAQYQSSIARGALLSTAYLLFYGAACILLTPSAHRWFTNRSPFPARLPP